LYCWSAFKRARMSGCKPFLPGMESVYALYTPGSGAAFNLS
jgi:hypothetical protein